MQLIVCGVTIIHSLAKIRGRLALSLLLFVLFFGFLLKNPPLATQSVADGLHLCAESLIPSLFPMIVLNGLLLRSPLPYYASRVLEKPMKRLFALNGACAFPLVSGCLSGFPLGVKNAVSLYKQGAIDREQAERVVCFCNNVSPAFALFAVGGRFFGEVRVGAILYACQLISALLCGIALGLGKKNSCEKHDTSTAKRIPCPDTPLIGVLSGAIAEAGSTLLTISAFAVFFRLLCDMLKAVFTPLALPDAFSALACGFLEITCGCVEASHLGKNGIALAALIFGWSSLSVHMQAAAFLLPEGLSMKRYLLSKSAQSLLTFFAVLLTAWNF